MKKTRRQCFKTGVRSTLLLSTAALTGSGSKGVSPEENLDLEMKPLGYGRSFICHEAPENSVRFWVESRTRILDDQAGRWADYYQCGFCKSEKTFAEVNLLKEDNYDFLPIFGDGKILLFLCHAFVSERYRTITPSAEVLWGPSTLVLKQDRLGEGIDEL